MQFITTVNWWQASKPTGANKPLDIHEDELAEAAFIRIGQMMVDGFTSGELLTNTGDDTDYRGHWSFEAHTPVGTHANPVVAVVKEDKENGGFSMSVSNVERCDVVLVEDDLCGDGNEIEIEGTMHVGWATTCDHDSTRTELFSSEF